MAHRRNVIVAFGSAIVGQGVAALVPVIQRVVIDDGIVGRSRPVGPWLAALAATAIFVFANDSWKQPYWCITASTLR